MSWAGFIMAVYVILQALGWDQFFEVKPEQHFKAVTQNGLGGNLGQPTIVAPFLAMIIPLKPQKVQFITYSV